MEEEKIPTTAKGLLIYIKGLVDDDVSPKDQRFKDALEALVEINDTNKDVMEEYATEIEAFQESMRNNPKFKNFQTIKEVTEGIGGAVDLFNTFSNISTAKRQIRDAEEAADALKEPAVPPVPPASEELKAATEDARVARTRPIREIDPILQRNLDLMNTDLSLAQTVSGGQAGMYGSMGQAAVNRARRANLGAIPAIQNIKRTQDAQYYDLIKAGMSETQARDAMRMGRFGEENKRYLTEAQAIGRLGAAGQYNLANQRAGLGSVIPEAVKPISTALVNNLRFNNKSEEAAPTSDQVFKKQYSALGNINPKYDDYLNNLNFSMEEVFNPKRRFTV